MIDENDRPPMIERRREERHRANVAVMVWGIDTRGERFLQPAHAREISLSGALLSGLDVELRCGDLMGVIYNEKKARYRVVWVRSSGTAQRIQAAVHLLAPDECPWQDLLAKELEAVATATSPTVL